MKRIIYFLFLITFNIFCQNITTIKIKTVKDSVGVKSTCLDCNNKRYAYKYEFEDSKDSLYIILSAGCGREGMDPTIKCRKSYKFVNSIADGVYKIVINGKPVEKISFKNGKKHGLECTYRQGQLGSLSNKGGYYFVQKYENGRTIEYYMLDKKGHVIGFSPVIIDQSNHSRIELTYYFDKKGQLRSLRYHTISVADFFSKNGNYINMELLSEDKRHNGKPSQRYIQQLKTIDKSGMIKQIKPNGIVEIKRFDSKYHLNFNEGVLLNWQYNTEIPTEDLDYQTPSNKIGLIGPDLLIFCKR